jgi:Contractile injection system tube protein/LysM domain
MAVPAGFQRAQLEIEGGSPIDCWFNPTQYSIAKSNTWTTRPAVGASLPSTQFGGGNARELSVELLFDAGPDGDVSGATDQLFQMMEVDPALDAGAPSQARPPTVKLSWGSFLSFKAVCRQLNVQFTLFRPDGAPTRATATLSLVQVAKDQRSGRGTRAPRQNPTTRADRLLRAHVVREGDSLQSIAYEHYGDPTRWRPIAEHNGIDDPLRLPRGRSLSIPLDKS